MIERAKRVQVIEKTKEYFCDRCGKNCTDDLNSEYLDIQTATYKTEEKDRPILGIKFCTETVYEKAKTGYVSVTYPPRGPIIVLCKDCKKDLYKFLLHHPKKGGKTNV